MFGAVTLDTAVGGESAGGPLYGRRRRQPYVNEVIAIVAQHDLALAIGHVAPEEALMILRVGKSAGVKRLIVTHPLLDPQFTYMSLEQLRAATEIGAFIEITGGAVIRDGEPKKRTLEALRTIGARHFFVGSDAGLRGRENHTDTLALAAKALRASGVTEADLTVMFKDNPAFLVNRRCSHADVSYVASGFSRTELIAICT